MKKLKFLKTIAASISIMIMSSTLVTCYESNSEQAPPPPVTDPVVPGIAANGKIYYQQNCSYCHSAGADDTTTAFGAIDLANQESRISNDISKNDAVYNTMGRFNNIDQERVDDLKKYLSEF